jgi:hypothetical protein
LPDFVQNLLEISARKPHPQSIPRGRTHPQANQMTCPKIPHINDWPVAGPHLWCRVGSAIVKKKKEGKVIPMHN